MTPQPSKHLAARIFLILSIIPSIIVIVGWLITLPYLNMPLDDRPGWTFDLELYTLPIATIIGVGVITPFLAMFSFLLRKSEQVAVPVHSKTKALLFRTFASIKIVAVLLFTLFVSSITIATVPIAVILSQFLLPLIIGLMITVFYVWYTIDLLRLRRWTLPLFLYETIGFSLASILYLLHLPFLPQIIWLRVSIALLLLIITTAAIWLVYQMRPAFTGPPRRLWKQVPILLFIIVSVSYSVLMQLFWDDLSVDDSDLQLAAPILVPQEENAYYNIPDIEALPDAQRNALHEADKYVSQIDSGSSTLAEVTASLAGTENIVADYVRASQKPFYQCPESSQTYGLDVAYCELNDLRDFANLSVLHSRIAAHSGDFDAATKFAVAPLQFSTAARAVPTSLDSIEYMVNVAILRIGTANIESLLKTHADELSIEQLSVLKETLTKSTLSADTLSNVYRREYLSHKNEIITNQPELITFSETSIDTSTRYHYLPNKTINLMADLSRANVALTTTNCSSVATQKEQAENALQYKVVDMYALVKFSSNFIGKVLFSVVLASSRSELSDLVCEVNDKLKGIEADIDQIIIDNKSRNTNTSGESD